MNKEEARAIKRVINEMGGEILLSMKDREILTPKERVRRRARADLSIEACNRCELRDGCASIDSDFAPLVPHYSPDHWGHEGRFAAVCDAPTQLEFHKMASGLGEMYQIMRAQCQDNGMSPDFMTWFSTTACMPHRVDRSGKVIRTPPGKTHVDACKGNTHAALFAADVRYVLLLGETAARGAWGSVQRWDRLVYRWGVLDGRWMVFPVEHPGVVLNSNMRNADARDRRDRWVRVVSHFLVAVKANSWTEMLPASCCWTTEGHRCTGMFFAYDEWGVAWCEEHFKPGKSTAFYANQGKRQVNRDQGMMFDE